MSDLWRGHFHRRQWTEAQLEERARAKAAESAGAGWKLVQPRFERVVGRPAAARHRVVRDRPRTRAQVTRCCTACSCCLDSRSAASADAAAPAAHRSDGDARLEGLVPAGPAFRGRHPPEHGRRHCGDASMSWPTASPCAPNSICSPAEPCDCMFPVGPAERVGSASRPSTGAPQRREISIAQSESPLLGVGAGSGRPGATRRVSCGRTQRGRSAAQRLGLLEHRCAGPGRTNAALLSINASSARCSAFRVMWPHRGGEHRSPGTPPAGRRGRMWRACVDERRHR